MVLVKSLSRFSRNTVECMEYIDRLKAHGVAVVFEKEGMNSMEPETQMLLSLYASMAQNESCSLSENMRWTRQQQAKLGDPIRRGCYGYRVVRDENGRGRKWVIHGEEAKRIQLIFRMAHQGYDLDEIRTALNQYEARQSSGDSWNRRRIVYALRQEAYRGDILTDKRVSLDYLKKRHVKNVGQSDQYYIEQHHEPIIDPDVFEEVQGYYENGYLSRRNKARRERWLEAHPEVLARRRGREKVEH